MQPLHTRRDLTLKVLEFLKDWGIERKIFSITLDNASSNDNIQTHVERTPMLVKYLSCYLMESSFILDVLHIP